MPTIPVTPTPARPPNVAYYMPGQSTPQSGPGKVGASPSVSTPGPAPPPKPTYPLPPRFLLVAFKEAPTEKFLIPLGSNSYVSRVGGDYVTSPAPLPPQVKEPSPVKVEIKEEPESVSAPTTEAPAKKRTRASMAKPPPPKEPTPEPEPEKEPTPAPPKKDPYADLPVVPGMKPDSGTVLLSTYLPMNGWHKPDWTKFQKRLPFDNPKFVEKLKAPSTTEQSSPIKSPQSPKRDLRPVQKPAKPPVTTREGMLNLAAENYLPAEGKVEPITIRIVGLNDQNWKRFKGVMDEVEKCELEALAWAEPELNKNAPESKPVTPPVSQTAASSTPATEPVKGAAASVPADSTARPGDAAVPAVPAAPATPATAAPAPATPAPETPAASVTASAQAPTATQPHQTPAQTSTPAPVSAAPAVAPTPASAKTTETPTPATPKAAPPSPAPQKKTLAPEVRETWLSRKKERFTSLLNRVGERVFPRFRVESTIPLITEATADKWALRPYHMTTRPLYTRDAGDGEEEGEEFMPLSPELAAKRGRKDPEPTVTFEMPVSLDALDERVEAGAAVSLSRRGRGRGSAPVRKFRRGTAGAICEGCGKPGLKVWRRGPNGRGTRE